jgi:DNA mismatch repair protein MutS
MIVDEIVEASDKYREKYGMNTVCLYQIGDFFEMNAYYESNELRGVDIYTVCNMINIQVTRKNKSIVDSSRNNPLMAGFPLAALNKYSSILVSNGWTVVVVRQVSLPPNVRREVTEIISPSTVLIPTSMDSNYLLCLVFDPNAVVSVAMAGIDVSTGACFTYEAYSTLTDPNFAYDEVYRIMESYEPREVLVILTKKCDAKIERDIYNCTHCHSHTVLHKKELEFENVESFQIDVFRRAFKHKDKELGLENYNQSRVALVAAIQFAYEHNDNIINKLELPQIIKQSKYLTLHYNSAIQLQVVGSTGSGSVNGESSEKPLLNLLNKCATPFGRRLFKDRLLSPVHDIDVLNKRYDEIDMLLPIYEDVLSKLSHVGDLERMIRRIRIGTFPPMDWPTLNVSLTYISEVLNILAKTDASLDEHYQHVKTVQSAFLQVINMEEASKYLIGDIKGSIFVKGFNKYVDDVSSNVDVQVAKLHTIERELLKIEACALDFNDRDGYFINITRRRWESVRSKTKRILDIPLSEFIAQPFSPNSNSMRVTHPTMEYASRTISDIRTTLQKLVTETYMTYLTTFDTKYGNTISDIIRIVGNLDVAATCARNAVNFKYVRPELVVNDQRAFVNAKDVRHPIIEQIHSDVAYVPNDVEVGKQYGGMLLYGLNSSGKSCYMKSIGLNVIMAQAGMYVSCSNMTLSPYHSIFTRIQNNDNVYKRMSSFTVEMTELRNIFQRCDTFSLVLGDELCSGTESVSATSIVAAGTYNLLSKCVGFVFATHLHELVDLPLIIDKNVSGDLRIAHIHVEATPSGTFIYDRKLTEGPGSSIYGLEVCSALGMPRDFVELAHSIRKHIHGKTSRITSSEQSNYNKDVFKNICEVCQTNPAEDVHHIVYRKVGGDNQQHNLVPLCKQCHDEEHNGNLRIKGYTMTSDGRKLDFKWQTKQHIENDTTTIDNTCTQDMINKIRPFLRYGAMGWQIKRTKKSEWRPISRESLLAFVEKKIGKDAFDAIDVDSLSSMFLVV